MKPLSEGQLRFSVVQPIHLMSWLFILFILKSISSLKPARLPVYQRKPFIAAWNAPTDQCLMKYNISLNLKMFQVIGSPLARARGQNITIFYVNRLGYYPWYTPQGVPINGGLPQNISLQVHLEKADQDISYYIPSEDFSGLAVIDWEYWRPQWARNWNTKDIYRQKSRKLISEMQENVSAADIENLAKATFEESAKAFMKETIELGIKSRPKGLWGYYLYPDCHNYNVYGPNYTGSCPEEEVLRNNELSWLWNSSAALYPSIGVRRSLGDSENVLRFSQFRVHESMRISTMTSRDYALPVFVYTRLGYRDQPLLFLSKQDLISTIGESAALGAAGIVIWGDMNLTSSEGNCTKVKQFVSSDLGSYIVNVTRAAELKSTPKAAFYVRNRVQEAIRLSKIASVESPLPVFVYHRPVFTDGSSTYLSQGDLVNSIGEIVALGASGIIMWGSLNLSLTMQSCMNLGNYLNTTLNPYLINVTLAAKMCSQVLCHDEGVCTRKQWNSSDYLHLNPMNFAIQNGKGGKYTVTGKVTLEDLQTFSDKFYCSCYANINCKKRVDIKNVHSVNVCMAEDICIDGPVKLQPNDHSSSQNEASTTTVSSISPSTTAATASPCTPEKQSPECLKLRCLEAISNVTQTGCQGVKWKNTSSQSSIQNIKNQTTY
ncbi:hypothetical protein AB1E18_003148 [Capra hircus]